MTNRDENTQISEANPQAPAKDVSIVEISVENLKGADMKEIGDFFDHFGTVINVQIKRKYQTAFPMEDLQDGTTFSEKRLCIAHDKLANNVTAEKVEKSSFESLTAVLSQHEIVQKIFSYLDISLQIRLESVCKQWRLIGKDSLWRRIKKLNLRPYIRNRPARFTTDAVVEGILSRCGKHLEEVKFTGTRLEEGTHEYEASILRSLHLIAQSCPNLLQIDCYRASITNKALRLLAKDCPNLEILILESSTCFNIVGLTTFVKLCKTLKSLQVSSIHDRDRDYFSVCINQNNNLRFLRIYPEFILLPKTIETLFNRFYPLEEIHLPRCSFLSAESLSNLFSRHGNNIKELYFELAPSMYDARMEWCEGLRLLNNVVRLSLREIGVDDTVCSILANNCMKLEHVDIRESVVTDTGLCHLATLPVLKILDVSLAGNITSVGIVTLAKRGKLEALFLGECSMQEADVGCSSLAKFCPNFSFLDASYLNISNLVVHSFVNAIESGFLKGHVCILVGGTDIDPSVKKCEKLQLEFRCQYSPFE